MSDWGLTVDEATWDSAWLFRMHVIVPAYARTAANGLAAQVGPGGAAELQTFSVPLSASGEAPATHYGCSTLATQAIRAALQANLGSVPGVLAYTCNAETGALLATTSQAAQAQVGQVWGWGQCLDDAGLQTVRAPV